MRKRGAEDFVVLTKTYDLLLWYVQQIGRFPRQHRSSLGVRIEKHLFRVMEWLTIARYQRPNQQTVRQAS
jgi:O-glycosyl hydrolase